MAELEYSVEARNVINRFYGVEKLVYVEGDDDVGFWECLFQKLTKLTVKAEETGGKERLQSRIQEIRRGEADYLVAIDRDFDWLRDEEPHPQILSTRGYSMENSVISDRALQHLISHVAKVPMRQVDIAKCGQWLAGIGASLNVLIIADAFNRNSGDGIAVVPDNCDRFLESNKSSKLAQQKITSYISKLGVNVSDEFKTEFINKMNDRGLMWEDVLRGHFLISAVLRFVKEYVGDLKGAISISREMLFSTLVMSFEAIFDNTHRHYDYYVEIVGSIK